MFRRHALCFKEKQVEKTTPHHDRCFLSDRLYLVTLPWCRCRSDTASQTVRLVSRTLDPHSCYCRSTRQVLKKQKHNYWDIAHGRRMRGKQGDAPPLDKHRLYDMYPKLVMLILKVSQRISVNSL